MLVVEVYGEEAAVRASLCLDCRCFLDFPIVELV